jgi:hypothetical protein
MYKIAGIQKSHLHKVTIFNGKWQQNIGLSTVVINVALYPAIRYKSGTNPQHKPSPCFSLLSGSLSAPF